MSQGRLSSKFSFKYDSRQSGSRTMLVEEVNMGKNDGQRTEHKLNLTNTNGSAPSCEVSNFFRVYSIG